MKVNEILNFQFWFANVVEYNLNYGQDLDMEEKKELTSEIRVAQTF